MRQNAVTILGSVLKIAKSAQNSTIQNATNQCANLVAALMGLVALLENAHI